MDEHREELEGVSDTEVRRWRQHEKKLAAEVEDIGDMAERVDREGAVGYLINPLWPADAYGVLGAQDKAGKTWAVLDAAVSVASGTPWLGRFPCQQGSVLVYAGEGGARNLVRRVRAIAEHKGIPFGTLRGHLRVSERAPRLKDDQALEDMYVELTLHRPALVIVDPLYLAAAGGKGSDLYAMGELLSGAQEVCQQLGAALMLSTHWNKTGTGAGAQRFTGVGPGAWGRVLGSGEVLHTDRGEDSRSIVDVAWEFVGSEIPETAFQMVREVWADDPSDLSSPLHYSVRVIEGFEALFRRPPSQQKVLDVLTANAGTRFSRRDLEQATGLKVYTVGEACRALESAGEIAAEATGSGKAKLYHVAVGQR